MDFIILKMFASGLTVGDSIFVCNMLYNIMHKMNKQTKQITGIQNTVIQSLQSNFVAWTNIEYVTKSKFILNVQSIWQIVQIKFDKDPLE